METFALYLIKSTVWLTGFFLIYIAFLRNERFFVLNRIYLVSGILLSILFPLFTWHYTVIFPVTPTAEVLEPQIVGAATVSETFQIQNLLLYFYLTGVLYLLFRLIKQTVSVWKVIRNSETHHFNSIKLIRTDRYPASFSFFSFVFVNPSIDEPETSEIINHEQEHIRQRHWMDLLLFEILRTMHWFNPVSWLYGWLIRQNHEYLADERALQRSSNPAIYRAALLNQMFGGPVISLANSFNYSLNKKRFNMMKQITYSPFRKLKLLLVLPLIAGVFYAFATPEYKFVEMENQTSQKALYYVGNDKVDISFTTQYEKEDLDKLKEDLTQFGIKIDYTSLNFTNEGKLKQISASIKYPDGSGGSFVSRELASTDGPGFRKEANGGSFVNIKLKTVHGKVIKEDGSPLKGTSIVVSGSTIGTMPDENGNFKLEVPDDSPIVFSFVGYESVKVKPDFDKEMVITMKRTIVEIEAMGNEVTSSQLESDVYLEKWSDIQKFFAGKKAPLYVRDGEIGKLVKPKPYMMKEMDTETIQSIKALSYKNAMGKYGEKGKNGVVEITTKKATASTPNKPSEVEVVGYGKMQNTNSSNHPTSAFKIRSTGTFDGSNPLIVINGVIAENQNMDNIDPETIQSISILKDEATTKKYGEKGKNGVVLITLKNSTSAKENTTSEVEVVGYGKMQNTNSSNHPTSAFKIRSTGTFDGSNPLIVINGVIAENQNVDNIDPETIESISILKDEATTKKYGEKGKNGVVEITLKKEKEVFIVVEEMPEYPGGVQALKAFVASTLKYPAIALENGIQGQVSVGFTVAEDGSVTDAKIERKVDPSLDQEALRIVNSMPKWKPGTQRGMPVSVKYELPINFTFPADYHPKSKEKLKEKK